MSDKEQSLTECFQESFQYNTISGFRSAISAYHDPIQGISVSKIPGVSDLLTGIFNKNRHNQILILYGIQKT